MSDKGRKMKFKHLTANIFESGPMPTTWKFLDSQSSQVVNWVKTKPGLAGNQIPIGGTRFGFTSIGVYNGGIIDTYSSKTKSASSDGNLISC